MRQLHSVAYHERFFASGIYVYERSGQPAGITESWTIHTLPDQSQRIRVDHDERSAPSGITILLEALCDASGVLQRFDLRLDNPDSASIKQARASYTLFADHIQIGRQLNDQPRQDEEIALPPSIVIYPPAFIFTGAVIRQIIQHGRVEVPVFTPRLTDDNQALSGIIEQRSASETDGQYRFAVRDDGLEAVFRLDPTGLLTVYEDQSMRVTLKNLARSNSFTE